MATNSGNSRVEQNLEILTAQIGRLTEGLYELRSDLREIKDILRQQAETTASLVRIVEKLSVTNLSNPNHQSEFKI